MNGLSPESRRQLHSRISSPAVDEALDFLINEMHGLGVFNLVPNVEGQKKAVMFRVGQSSPFSVISNASWLLWYFRRPGLRAGLFTFDELAGQFADFEKSKRKDPGKSEGILRLGSRADVEDVLDFVRPLQPRLLALSV